MEIIVYIRCGYTDMRKQLNRLLDIIQYSFRLDLYSNFLFLFCGKRTDQIKAVHYEWDGFCLLYKRYERKQAPPMAANRRRSKTDIRTAAPLASGRFEPGAAKSCSKMTSTQVEETRKILKSLGNLTVLWYDKSIETERFSAHAKHRTGV